MNITKVKKALRRNINHLSENNQTKIKDLLYHAAKSDGQTFENLVNRLARKRGIVQEREVAYQEHIASPEYNIPYVWSRKTPRRDS